MVSLPLGGLDEAKKLQLRHSLDKPGAVEQAEEQHSRHSKHLIGHEHFFKRLVQNEANVAEHDGKSKLLKDTV